MRVGSPNASVNGRALQLDAAVTDLNGTTYMPQRILTDALGAVVTYDQRGSKVEIVSAEIGRQAGTQQSRSDGGTNVQGIASAVDENSVPPSITLVQGAISHTINMTSDAKIYVEDVTIHMQTKGTLDDVHVGDQVLIVMTREGRVSEVHDFYKSTSGTISAVSPASFVLGSGRVVTPGKTTDIALNGAPAKLGDLLVGDFVTVRSNPETGELRQIIASRNGAAAPSATASAAASGPAAVITQVTISAGRALHAGETVDVTLLGTPGGHATFDIGEYVTGIDMREDTPGTYRGRFTIPDRFNVTQIPVYGHLTVGANAAPRAVAPTQLSAATTPPAITDVAPPPNQTVNNSRPSIYATFAAPTDIPINTSSVSLDVNGHDVTASTTRSNSFVTYSPGVDYPDGLVTVTVHVSDSAGNTASRSWSFTIRTR
jgi:hypothetical protein